MTISDSARCDDGDASGEIDDKKIIYLDEDIDKESNFSDSDWIILYFSRILLFFKRLFNLLLDLFSDCFIVILDPKAYI